MDKASPPKPVIALVERFRNHADYYCSGQYKETDLRNEFLDPFFEALAWDSTPRPVCHCRQHAPAACRARKE